MISEKNTYWAASWGQPHSEGGVAFTEVLMMTSLRRLRGDSEKTPVEVDSKDVTFAVAAVSKLLPVMFQREQKYSSKLTLRFL